jgi:hypothetical protein
MLMAMKGYMFQSKAGALLFVIVTLIGVAALVGTEEEDGALISAAERIERQGAELNDARTDPASDSGPETIVVVEEEEEPSFASDDELILDPTGLEPVGMEPNPVANVAEEVVLVESSAEIVTE